MSGSRIVLRRPHHCYKGANYAKYRVLIEIEQVPLLDNNLLYNMKFIPTNYHAPKPGYIEYSYIDSHCRLSKSVFSKMLSSMGITKYEIPIQHVKSKYWNK